ncbi:MAG TPA: KilA-N domain-containing protein [Patescibacteria group bacterium]|nr:KilA-N domain-containing protein [Patescibacteria group bacterium]
MKRNTKLAMSVHESNINVAKVGAEDYICLTDMARSAGADRALHSWLRSKNTIDFLGFWEKINNPDFKIHEFVYFKNNAGSNSFNPSVADWILKTGAKGIFSKKGRYGGTYAHKDIAFEFGSWLSPEFKLLIITEFQRLKEREQKFARWDAHRYLSRVNYKLHTDSIKNVLLPFLQLAKSDETFVYIDEADLLNKIVFGQTASEWRAKNKKLTKSGRNQRDYASSQELVILANLENLNAHFINEKKTQKERVTLLIDSAERQLRTFIKEDEEEQKLLEAKK